jgi:cytochrome c biogenesis protein
MGNEKGIENRPPRRINLRRLASWAALMLTLLLIAFSIYGAFIGSETAKRFFNSAPLAVYWLLFLILLISAIWVFHRLLHLRGLFLIHIGCVVVLAGGISGSRAGLKIQDSLFGTNTIYAGELVIYEGKSGNAVMTEDGSTKVLPFAIKLDDFKIEYYQPGQLLIQTCEGIGYRIPAKAGLQYNLGNNLGSVAIVRKFESFKLLLEDNKKVAIDDPNGKPNPALEILLKQPDGSEKTRYVFERFAGHTNPGDTMAFSYLRMVKQFISDVEVVKDGKTLARKSIEVNKPLRFGGYLFYQQGYDEDSGRFTVLRVTSDKGLGIVYLGYILLCAGVLWHLWFRHIFGDRVIED